MRPTEYIPIVLKNSGSDARQGSFDDRISVSRSDGVTEYRRVDRSGVRLSAGTALWSVEGFRYIDGDADPLGTSAIHLIHIEFFADNPRAASAMCDRFLEELARNGGLIETNARYDEPVDDLADAGIRSHNVTVSVPGTLFVD